MPHRLTRLVSAILCTVVLLSLVFLNVTPTQALAPAWQPNTAYAVNQLA
ncbi:MAG: hypothetical protein JOZ51_25070, partial [Chloroflexi bacterium]|nr:hypothetical protein [Chloroflexota bacterium]